MSVKKKVVTALAALALAGAGTSIAMPAFAEEGGGSAGDPSLCEQIAGEPSGDAEDPANVGVLASATSPEGVVMSVPDVPENADVNVIKLVSPNPTVEGYGDDEWSFLGSFMFVADGQPGGDGYACVNVHVGKEYAGRQVRLSGLVFIANYNWFHKAVSFDPVTVDADGNAAFDIDVRISGIDPSEYANHDQNEFTDLALAVLVQGIDTGSATEDGGDTGDPAGGDSVVVAGFAGDTRLADLSDAEVAQVFDARLVAQGGLPAVPGVRIWFEDENGKFVAGMKPGDVMSDEVWHEIHEVRVKGGWHVRITSDVLPANFEAVAPVKAARGEKLNVDYVVPCDGEPVSIVGSNNPWKSGNGVTAVHMFDFGDGDVTDAAAAAYVRDRYETVADVPLFALNQGTGGGYYPINVDGCAVGAKVSASTSTQAESLPDAGSKAGVLAVGALSTLLAGVGLLAIRRRNA